MKKLPIVMLMMMGSLVMGAAKAPEPKASTPTISNERIDARIKASTTTTNEKKVKLGRVTYGGAAVTAVKSRNPLQLINPFAPMSYGSGEDNVVRDTVSGRARGVDVASVRF